MKGRFREAAYFLYTLWQSSVAHSSTNTELQFPCTSPKTVEIMDYCFDCDRDFPNAFGLNRRRLEGGRRLGARTGQPP